MIIGKSIKNTIDVKQVDILGPIFFLFFICAIMITWRANINPCIFRSKNDKKMTGRTYTARGEEFFLLDAYPMQTISVSSSSSITEIILSQDQLVLLNNLTVLGLRFTLVSSNLEKIKTEVLFCSKPSSFYNTPDTLHDDDLSDIILNDRYIPIVQQFCTSGVSS